MRSTPSQDPRTRRSRALAVGSLVLFLSLALPGPTSAQDGAEAVDPGWLPWLGCWTVVAGDAAGEEETPPTLCVRAAGDGPGVELVTARDGEITEREVLRADGRRRSSARDGCEGWERARFSGDGHRVYVRSEHVCPGGVRRTSSSLLAWVSPSEWIEIRAVEVRGAPRTWVRRHRLAAPEEVAGAGLTELAAEEGMAIESARMAAAGPVRVEDVLEASGRLPAEATAAWIAERGDPLELDADALLRMADAGVPERVIDVAVGVSFPDRFSVGPSGSVEESGSAAASRGSSRGSRGYRGRPPRGRWYGGWYGRPYGYWRNGFGDPFFHDPFYRPFARPGFGFGFAHGFRPTVVRVVPRSERDRDGRVVNGRGYTRDRPADERAVPPPRSGSDRSPPRTPSTSRGGRSPGAGASLSPSGGYRSGGSGSGRTARPRRGSGSDGDGSGSGGR